MISLKQSMKAMDEAEAVHRAVAKAFAEAVETSAAHVVEVNRHDAAEFREQVLHLADRVSQSTEAGDLEAARTAFRGELREYSEKASRHIRQLREELDAAASAMQTFAQGVSASTGAHETVLKQEFKQLERAAEATDVERVRAQIHSTVHAVNESYETLKQAHALVIAQLRDEIRVLQSELQRGQRKPALRLGVAEKRVVDQEIEELLRQDRAFVVVLIAVPDHIEEAAFDELVRNLGFLSQRATLATWGSHVYALVLPGGIDLEKWQRTLASPSTRLELVERAQRETHPVFFGRLARSTEVIRKQVTS